MKWSIPPEIRPLGYAVVGAGGSRLKKTAGHPEGSGRHFAGCYRRRSDQRIEVDAQNHSETCGGIKPQRISGWTQHNSSTGQRIEIHLAAQSQTPQKKSMMKDEI